MPISVVCANLQFQYDESGSGLLWSFAASIAIRHLQPCMVITSNFYDVECAATHYCYGH